MPRRAAPMEALSLPVPKGWEAAAIAMPSPVLPSLSRKTSVPPPSFPITDLGPQEKGTIAFIRGDCRVVQRLSDLGLTLGTTVSVTRKAPMNGPVEVFVRRTKLAIDHSIAENIFVDASRGGQP